MPFTFTKLLLQNYFLENFNSYRCLSPVHKQLIKFNTPNKTNQSTLIKNKINLITKESYAFQMLSYFKVYHIIKRIFDIDSNEEDKLKKKSLIGSS